MSAKSTVLFILHLPPPVHGAAMMGKYIHDSKLINDSFDCHYVNLTTAKDLQDIGKGGMKKLWRFLKLLATIRGEVKRLKPQLVYVTPNAKGWAFYKDFVVVQRLKSMGCKVVVHYHNKGVSTRQDCRLDNWLYHRFFKNVKVILLAESLFGDVQKYVNKEDVFICPNGIPVSNMSVQAVIGEKPRLLFLSNLLEEKGVIVLLDALEILKQNGCDFVCNFVGGETNEINAQRFHEEVERRGLDDFAIYLGKKYGAEKNRIFEESDIFVFPTYYRNECFPLVLLEAMEHGLPCISTNEGGICSIIEDGKTGFVVEKRRSEMLAEKIMFLMQHPDMKKAMGVAARKKFEEKFTLERFEQGLKSILGELV